MNRLYAFIMLLILLLQAPACQQNPYSRGQELYENICMSCHGYDGIGLNQLIPPLAGSDFWQKSKSEIPCIIRNGSSAPVIVNGQTYDMQSMPANPDLAEGDIANIINYINSKWGDKQAYMSPEQADSLLRNCKL